MLPRLLQEVTQEELRVAYVRSKDTNWLVDDVSSGIKSIKPVEISSRIFFLGNTQYLTTCGPEWRSNIKGGSEFEYCKDWTRWSEVIPLHLKLCDSVKKNLFIYSADLNTRSPGTCSVPWTPPLPGAGLVPPAVKVGALCSPPRAAVMAWRCKDARSIPAHGACWWGRGDAWEQGRATHLRTPCRHHPRDHFPLLCADEAQTEQLHWSQLSQGLDRDLFKAPQL